MKRVLLFPAWCLLAAFAMRGLLPHAWAATPPKYHRFEPLSPAESLKEITVPAGYRVEIVAAEPMIQEPVWVAWDGNGAMYVAEMNSYMQDVHGTGTKTQRNGRIKRLIDHDGDGVMDAVTVFVDGLLLPRMILALDDRILVQETDSTSIVAYRDTNADGVADERTVLYEGTPVASSVEHQDSALTWNLDNWMYTAQGGHRFRFTRGRWERERVLEDLSNQWGLGMDDTGLLYHSTNHVPGRNFNQHWYYWNLVGENLNWQRFQRPNLGPETDEAFQRTYRTQPIGDRGDTARTSWTSACGLSIYRGDALPAEFHGNMLLAEPCAHAVRRAIVTRDANGQRFLRNPHQDQAAEFFMSADFYSRPVSTHAGPDGCLYIVDMYRGMIQDAPWVSPDFARRIQGMGADQVRNRGRIYRIAHESRSPGPQPRLLETPSAALVGHLAHANGWWRDMAQRLLILRRDRAVIPALHATARTHSNPLARLHALWTLEGLDALAPEIVAEKLRDPDYRLRAAAVRLHEPALRRGDSAKAVAALETLAEDPDPEVRRQVMLSLGWSKAPAATELMAQIATCEPANPIMALAALTALHGREELPLVKRARDGSLFSTISDPAARARAQGVWQSGLQAWKAVGAPKPGREPAAQARFDEGSRIYDQVCVTCHGLDGRGARVAGANPLAPALDGSPRVLGAKEALARILLHGLVGPVEGAQFETGQMAALGATMPDAWTAAILTYIRQAWTNSAAAISPDEVALIRRVTVGRSTPWTLTELAALRAPLLRDRSGWVATASGHRAQNAIDGINDDSHDHAWHGSQNPGVWLAVDLGRNHRLTQVDMLTTDAAWAPRGYTVEISTDGATWSPPIVRGVGTGLRTSASFEPTMARHVRITQTGNAIERWVVSELEIYGEPGTGPADAIVPRSK